MRWRVAGLVAALMLLATCGRLAPEDGAGDVEVARAAPVAGIDAPAPVLDAEMEDGTTSAIIAGLLDRRSVLEPGPLATVAQAVMAANTRAAEADLRAATLRAEAKAQNWLPRLGPAVNLTSLGSIVTSLVLNQAILDHGARAAERDFARADVEVAAVALAEDSNARVAQALDLYIAAAAARARAAAIRDGMARMDRYAWIMSERVAAGVNDRADLQVVEQRRDQLLSDLAADEEAAAVALAELQAMAALPVETLSGLSGVNAPDPAARALTVIRAEAEGARALAEARMARAGFLPGLSVGGDLGGDGLGLTLGAPNGLGMGQGAAMEAAMAQAVAVEARVGQEEEAAAREIAALEGRLAALIRQADEARSMAAQAADNFALFAEQQAAGQRAVPETTGVLETMIRAERAAVDLRYDIARMQVRIAARLGQLVDGERM